MKKYQPKESHPVQWHPAFPTALLWKEFKGQAAHLWILKKFWLKHLRRNNNLLLGFSPY